MVNFFKNNVLIVIGVGLLSGIFFGVLGAVFGFSETLSSFPGITAGIAAVLIANKKGVLDIKSK